jgi:DNA helicase MCM8
VDEDGRCSAPPNALNFQPRDLEFVVKYAEEHAGDQFRQLLHSICPAIYGHELVKGETFLESLTWSH